MFKDKGTKTAPLIENSTRANAKDGSTSKGAEACTATKENATQALPQAVETPDADEQSETQKDKGIAVFGRTFSKKQVCMAGIGFLCAVAAAGVLLSCSVSGTATTATSDTALSSQAGQEPQGKVGTESAERTKAAKASTAKTAKTDGNAGKTNDSNEDNSSKDSPNKKSARKVSAASSGKSDSGSNTSTSKKDTSSGSSSKTESKGNTSGNSGSSSKKEESTHQHNWVAQTKTVHHDAQYRTVHHDAVTHQVWHDAITKCVSICNNCGADITGNEASHFKNSLLNGGNCGSCHDEYKTVTEGYSETITDQAAYDEQVQTSAAWDETVTTGYKCSTCDATK